jgi:hypothetical protein
MQFPALYIEERTFLSPVSAARARNDKSLQRLKFVREIRKKKGPGEEQMLLCQSTDNWKIVGCMHQGTFDFNEFSSSGTVLVHTPHKKLSREEQGGSGFVPVHHTSTLYTTLVWWPHSEQLPSWCPSSVRSFRCTIDSLVNFCQGTGS